MPYKTDSTHIEDKIIEMKKLMDGKKIPTLNKYCQNCNYIKAGNKFL